MSAMWVQSAAGQCRTLARALWEVVVHVSSEGHGVRRLYERIRPYRIPHPVRSVLFVCTANICRSPLAESYFRSIVQASGRAIEVCSAGLETAAGEPANLAAICVARDQGLILHGHATRVLFADLVKSSDLIVVMELAQKDRITRVYPQADGKVVLLGYFDKEGPLEIADPYGRALDQFAVCFAQIRRGCDALLKTLLKNSPPV